MTCLEKFVTNNPATPMDQYGLPWTCPHDWGYIERPDWCGSRLDNSVCIQCWNREIPECKEVGPIMPSVLYRCDRRACLTCSYPDCQHTPDISHAVDFHKNENGTYVED